MSVLYEPPLLRWLRVERAREQRRKQAATTDRGDRFRPNRFRLARLTVSDRLTPEERDFVATLVRARTLSPEQTRRFDEI
jgi:hypothetical protein